MNVIRRFVSVVDDDDSVRESLPDLLREFGDVAMPGMSGPELQRELRCHMHRIPIVFITAHADEAVRLRALGHGAVQCLIKPFSETALLEALNVALSDP